MVGEQIRAWHGQILSLVRQVGVLFERTPLQWGCGQEGEEEEGSWSLVFTWGNGGSSSAAQGSCTQWCVLCQTAGRAEGSFLLQRHGWKKGALALS